MKLNKDHYLSIFYIGLGILILFFTSRIDVYKRQGLDRVVRAG